MNSFQFLSRSSRYRNSLVKIRLNSNRTKYLKKLIKLNGGDIMNTNNFSFIKVPKQFKTKLQEIIVKEIKNKLKKQLQDYGGIIISILVARYGFECLIATIAYDTMVRSELANAIKINILFVVWTGKILSFLALGFEIGECGKQIGFLIRTKAEMAKISYFSIKSILKIGSKNLLSLPSSEYNYNYNWRIRLLIMKQACLIFSISSGIFLEIASAVSEPFSLAIANNLSFRLGVLRQLVGVSAIIGMQMGGFKVQGVTKFVNLTAVEKITLFMNTQILYSLLTTRAIGALRNSCLPAQADSTLLENNSLKNNIFSDTNHKSETNELKDLSTRHIDIFSDTKQKSKISRSKDLSTTKINDLGNQIIEDKSGSSYKDALEFANSQSSKSKIN